jgi:hypothetical protein
MGNQKHNGSFFIVQRYRTGTAPDCSLSSKIVEKVPTVYFSRAVKIVTGTVENICVFVRGIFVLLDGRVSRVGTWQRSCSSVPRRALWPTLIFCHVKVRIL